MKVQKIWEYKCDEQFLGIEIGSLIGNSQQNLVYTKSGKILIFAYDGEKLLEEEISNNSPIWDVVINDIDNDGRKEIIIAGFDGILRVFKHKSLILEPFWAHQFGASISGLLINDINIDGIEELIAYSLDNSVRVLNPFDGSLIWGQLFEDGVGDVIIWEDQESKNKEMIAGGNDGTIRAFKHQNGELLWFKRFENKIRCVCDMRTSSNDYFLCGGDDKILHIIERSKQEEVKSIVLDEIVWKCLSFPPHVRNNVLVSTYSFQYFEKDLQIDEIEFKSKLLCFDENLNISWKIDNINVETLKYYPSLTKSPIIIGTTKGNLIFIDEFTGKIKMSVSNDSCINDVKYDVDSKILFTCTDKGTITAYFLEDN